MKEYATVISFAIPLFMLLILAEYLVGRKRKLTIYRAYDTICSLSSGITNVVKDILGLIIVIISYGWMYEHLALMTIQNSVLLYILAFIALDFAGYWIHRFEHTINLFWNRHIIHHSSEEFNLACALRQNFSAVFAVFTFLLLPAAILGIPPSVINIVGPIHLFAQFWYHTRLIDKMGFWEHIIVTPSHHRVHHAINDVYLDKNYAQIFIIWDKLFGTFQKELDDIKPIYGVKRPVHTWNAIHINFQHFWLLCKDAYRTKNWLDKCRIWFMPTGWRPGDVSSIYPTMEISSSGPMIKYNHVNIPAARPWMWAELFVTLIFLFHFFSCIGDYDYPYLLMYGVFIIAHVYSYGALMDGHKLAFVGEAIKGVIMVFLAIQLKSWFGISLLPIIIFSVMNVVYIFWIIRAEPQHFSAAYSVE